MNSRSERGEAWITAVALVCVASACSATSSSDHGGDGAAADARVPDGSDTPLDAGFETEAEPVDSPAGTEAMDAPSEVGDVSLAEASFEASADSGSTEASGGADGSGGSDAAGDASPCSGSQLLCGGLCVPNDAVNCGACGRDCTASHATSTPTCTAGQCMFPGLTCAPGWAHCSSTPSDGCETNVTSAAHCGGCGTACTSPPICAVSGDAGAPACLRATAVAVGYDFSLALLSTGNVDSWGTNFGGFYVGYGGQLGTGTTDTMTAKPAAVSNTTTATAIAAGDGHACALLSGGTVECWGANAWGEIGIDPMVSTESDVPAVVPGLTNVTAIAVGGSISCALIAGGTVKCWGNNNDGELGNATATKCNGTDMCTPTPTAVTGLTNVTAITIGNEIDRGADHVCALLTDHTIKCWGYDGDGELGNGNIIPTGGTATPVVVSNISTAIDVQGHSYGVCAVLSGGSVKCWGDNSVGLLGNGSTNASPSPVSVSNLTDAASLSVGATADTICAVRTNGHAVCWGWNNDGQLGSGAASTTTQALTPVAVTGLTGVSQIATGFDHSCGLLTTGDVFCWGSNFSAELANAGAATGYNSTPLPVQW